MQRIFPLAALSLLAAGPLAGQDIVGRADKTFTLSESVAAGGWVRVATFNGRIEITSGGSGQVEIRAVKEVRRGEIGRRALGVILGAYESMKTGARVDLRGL